MSPAQTAAASTTALIHGMGARIFRSPMAFGQCVTVDPRSTQAAAILRSIESVFTKCSMCDDKAVRVGVFEVDDPYSGYRKDGSEFRGLCERHKVFGLWSEWPLRGDF